MKSTLQVYPTQVRSFGLGVCNACSRFGALLSPFLTVDLVEHGHSRLAESTLAACCAIAAVLTWLLPIETKARSLLVSVQPARKPLLGSSSVRYCLKGYLANPVHPRYSYESML